MSASLGADGLRALLVAVAARIEEGKDELGAADRATGDGDHGVALARGFAAVRTRLAGRSLERPGEMLVAVGNALIGSAGGAAGVVFGTFFRDGGAALAEREEFDGAALRCFLATGLEAVQHRGQAAPGDKTMLDALAPAVRAVEERAGASLDELLRAAADAARDGVEQTKLMTARVGKARSLGERSLGHVDPGALSVALILEAMADEAERATR
jgi:dihydroxyacetone kinase-like protein